MVINREDGWVSKAKYIMTIMNLSNWIYDNSDLNVIDSLWYNIKEGNNNFPTREVLNRKLIKTTHGVSLWKTSKSSLGMKSDYGLILLCFLESPNFFTAPLNVR